MRFFCSVLFLTALVSAGVFLSHRTQVAHAQELTVGQLIALLQASGIITPQKAQEAMQAVGILGYERVETPSNVSCPQINRTLSVGMEGSDVSALQAFLKTMPHVYPNSATSGYFGALTQSAVMRYQAGLNIIASGSPSTTGFGTVGPKTRSALARCARVPAPKPTTPAPTIPSVNGTKLSFVFPPVDHLNPITYGGVIALYHQVYAGFEANIALAPLDLLGQNKVPMPDVAVYVVRSDGPPQLVVFVPDARTYKVFLNDGVSAKDVYVLNRKGLLGYRDILVQTQDGKNVTYTFSEKGTYARILND